MVVWTRERGKDDMSKLVMIIDDSPTVRKIIETSLRREGFQSVKYPEEIETLRASTDPRSSMPDLVVSYADGIQALGALTDPRHPIPDVVILDIGLPKMDGYEIARHLRTKQRFNNSVIIMLSGRDGVIDRLKGRLAGAKEYLTKPFKTQDVLSAIHSYIGVPTLI
jgi:twitching motility two-component system response regulator PilG